MKRQATEEGRGHARDGLIDIREQAKLKKVATNLQQMQAGQPDKFYQYTYYAQSRKNVQRLKENLSRIKGNQNYIKNAERTKELLRGSQTNQTNKNIQKPLRPREESASRREGQASIGKQVDIHQLIYKLRKHKGHSKNSSISLSNMN